MAGILTASNISRTSVVAEILTASYTSRALGFEAQPNLRDRILTPEPSPLTPNPHVH
jgi:hypothetical protein